MSLPPGLMPMPMLQTILNGISIKA